MSPRLRGRRRRSDLPAMLAALDAAVRAIEGRADPEVIGRARAVAGRAGERLRLSGEHTVVALAGSTGSGKSSLFNALVGGAVSPVGVRRPTTAKAHAAVWGPSGAAPLLQWLGVPRKQTTWRHGAVDAWGRERDAYSPEDELDGLVLLDLPDHDSTVTEHRQEVDRLVELVDLLVWVVDPQKYADEVLHERYLRRLSGHAAVIVVVLNQTDTVGAEAAAQCATDLRRLLDEDGLRRSPLLTTSARTGAGVDDLRSLLVEAVDRRRARNDRLVADVESVVGSLVPCVASDEVSGVPRRERDQLVDALAAAAGVPVIGKAVESSWRLRASGSLGWPATRWLRRLRPDPLRRLHLSGQVRKDVVSMTRSSLPEPTPVQRAQVDTALRRLTDRVGADLPRPWQQAVEEAAHGRSADVRDQLDRAVVSTDLGVARTPMWCAGRGAGALAAARRGCPRGAVAGRPRLGQLSAAPRTADSRVRRSRRARAAADRRTPRRAASRAGVAQHRGRRRTGPAEAG
jgi:GTP-binding protein EngB required for normal cell division